MENVIIKTEFIKLDQFLKFSGECSSGTEAKFFIQNDEVLVNGEIETRRGKKLRNDDIVEINSNKYKIIQE